MNPQAETCAGRRDAGRVLPKYWIIVLLAGFALACAGAAVLLGPKPEVAILPNGNRLTLEKVTFGTNHVFSSHPRFLDSAFQAVPLLGKLIHVSTRIATPSSEKRFCLWLSSFNPRSNTYLGDLWQAAQVVDEHGCILYMNHRGYDRGEGPKHIRSVFLEAWPRQQKQFTVNIFNGYSQGDQPIATFTVRNPDYVKPAAQPEARRLPAEVVAGPVTVRLVDISVRQMPPTTPYLWPKCEFLEQGKPSRDWRLEEVTWHDANGNEPGHWGASSVCQRAPVWKLEACVFKKPEAQFPPQNVWGVPALKLPGPGEFSALSFSTNLQGARLSLLGIAGPGTVAYSNGAPVKATAAAADDGTRVFSDWIEVRSRRHHLALDCAGLGPDQRVDLRCRQSPSGKPGAELTMTSSVGTCRFYLIKVAPETGTIQLEAIVHSGQRVEFDVKPTTN